MAEKWSRCPSCGGNAEAIAAVKAALLAKYGQLSASAFIKAADEARDQIDGLKATEELTLHESIEVGIVGKVFGVTYVAACSRCDFKYAFVKDVKVLETQHVDPLAAR